MEFPSRWLVQLPLRPARASGTRVDRGRDHPLSRLEGVVQRSLRNAGPLADLVHADRRNTLLGDDDARLIKNATATLDNTFLPERIVVKSGTNTTEFVYTNFQDFNNPLFKIEALMPATMVERRNGTLVRELKSKVTEIGQIYVIVPVPDSVRKAGGK